MLILQVTSRPGIPLRVLRGVRAMSDLAVTERPHWRMLSRQVSARIPVKMKEIPAFFFLS
jgi:hypothetical protein